MKFKIVLIMILSGLCFISANAQWKKVFYDSTANGLFPMYSYKNTIFASTYNGIYLSNDSGNSWKSIDSPSNGLLTLKFLEKDSIFYCQSNYAKIYNSFDTGRTWHFVGGYPKYCLINDAHVFGNMIVLASDKYRILISKDNGKSWDTANIGLPHADLQHGELMGVDAVGNKLLAFYVRGYLYSSVDSAKSWQYVTSKAPGLGAANIHIGNSIYMGGNGNTNNLNAISESIDSGKTWSILFKTPKSSDIISGMATDGHLIFAATGNEGVVYSRDSGHNWIFVNTGLSDLITYSVLILGDNVYVSTKNAIYKNSIATVTGMENFSGSFDRDLNNLKVYPNPFKHSTTFEFGRVIQSGQLLLYNILGQEVSHIDNINAEKMILECDALSAGTYLYLLLEKGKKTATGKIIINR